MSRNAAPDLVSSGLVSTDAAIRLTRTRLRMMDLLRALTLGLLCGVSLYVGLHALASFVPGEPPRSAAAGVFAAAAASVAALVAAVFWLRRRTFAASAGVLQERAGGMDNLLVTAVEAAAADAADAADATDGADAADAADLADRAGGRPGTVHPVILAPLVEQCEARVAALRVSTLVPVLPSAALCAAVALGAGLVVWGIGGTVPAARITSTGLAVPDVPAAAGTLRVLVTPPSYAGRQAETFDAPEDIEVLEGSLVRIEIRGATAAPRLIEGGGEPSAFEEDGDTYAAEITADRSRFLLIRTGAPAHVDDRLLTVKVVPDAAPTVRIREPARDLAFPAAEGSVPVTIEASDDLAVGSLALRYIRASGSGENVSFTEGEIPVEIDTRAPDRWTASATLSLAALGLENGDTLVYRAVSRDRRPGRDWSTSELYLIEVGKVTSTVSAGFALPPEEDRHAISQQMVILKTERLDAARPKLAAADVQEQARMLAVEQRMVRAEFVFMTGGEVEDEVAEAEHSHDLAEGRLENEAQVELLNAIREMSRAEERLNEADVPQALVFERRALDALQRAFDRRRYLLRTMPERARIDRTRRLTGDLDEARSWRRGGPEAAVPEALAGLSALARDLARAEPAALVALAARLAAVDPDAEDVQRAATALAAARGADAEARQDAIDAAVALVTARAMRLLAPADPWVPGDPALGRLSDVRTGESP